MSYTPRHAKPSPWKRRAVSAAAGFGVVATLAAPPASASAQPKLPELPQVPEFSSNSGASVDAFVADARAQLSNLGSNIDQAARDAAWDTRNALRQQADALAVFGPDVPAQAKAGVDQVVETLFPGLIAERTAPAPAPAPAPAANPAPAPAASDFDYGPCPADAKACVDLDGHRSWLQNNGQKYYGPVRISSGRPGQETPRGTFYVNRKVKDEISYEFNNAPMPYSVYFTNNGIAFHQDDPYVESAGCIHLYQADAQRYFNDLQLGDKVYVY